MKKLLTSILVLALCLASAGCAKDNAAPSSSLAAEQSVESTMESSAEASTESSIAKEQSGAVSFMDQDFDRVRIAYTAYDFFRAYVQGDIETARLMTDTPDNECLEYFSSADACIGSMDKITDYAVEFISYDKDAATDVETVTIDIHYSTEEFDFISYMCVTLVTRQVQDGDYTYKVWKVAHYDFDA